MKKITLLTITFFTFFNFLQAQTNCGKEWQWLKYAKPESKHNSYPYDMVGDNAGNVYVVGEFDMADLKIDSIVIDHKGSRDVFIMKFNKKGEILWAKGIGGGFNEDRPSIDLDDEDNVYVAGTFESGLLYLDSLKVERLNNHRGGFLAKLDKNGTPVFLKALQGNDEGSIYFRGIKVSGQKVYVTGTYSNEKFKFHNDVFEDNGANLKFLLAEYNLNGNEIKMISNQSLGLRGVDIAVDTDSNIYVASVVTGEWFFKNKRYWNKRNNTLIMKFNHKLKEDTVFYFKNEYNNIPVQIKIKDSFVYTAFSRYFNDITIDSTVINGIGTGGNLLITKQSLRGDLKWYFNAGAKGTSLMPFAIEITPSNEVFFSSDIISNTLYLGGDTFYNNISSNGYWVIGQLDDKGKLKWKYFIKNKTELRAPVLTQDSEGSIYIAGNYSRDSIEFESLKAPFTNNEHFVMIKTTNDFGLKMEKEEPICYGDYNGAVKATTLGGVAPFKLKWKTGEDVSKLENKGPGAYIATLTDSRGCSKTDTIELTWPAEPLRVEFMVKDDTNWQRLGSAKAKIFGGIAPYTYQWDFWETKELEIKELTPNKYWFRIKDERGCAFDTFATIVNATSIAELEGKVVKVFPNPVNNKLNIELPDEFEFNHILFDLHGKTIQKGDSRTIDFSNLSKGVYFLEITANEKTIRFKILK